MGVGAASAQPAALRLACEGESLRAEVTVNGKPAGECPVDVQVPPGNVKIEAVRRIDADRERFFSDEFRVAPGTAKRVQIELGPAGPNAEGRRLAAAQEDQAWAAATSARNAAGYRSYLARFPQGRRAADARAALATFPPRPEFPVPVGEAVLARLESSEAFAGAAQPRRAYRVVSDTTVTVPGAGGTRFSGDTRTTAPGSGYESTTSRSTVTLAGHAPSPSVLTQVTSLGGLLELSSRYDSNGSMLTSLKSIEQLSGSLVPPREGAELQLRYTSTMHHIKSEARHRASCRMAAPVEASTLNTRLAGKAWPVICEKEWVLEMPGYPTGAPRKTALKMHYLEDLGVFSNLVGAGGPDGVVPMPAAGAKLEAGDTTTVIHRFDVAFD